MVNYSTKVGSLLFGISILTGTAFASENLTGVWHGKVQFDMSNLPKLKSPRQNTARMAALNKIQQASLTLNLKANGTYTLVTIGAPKSTPQVNGTWNSNGTTLSLQMMNAGREYGLPQVYTVDKGRKSLSITKTGSGITTTVSFYR